MLNQDKVKEIEDISDITPSSEVYNAKSSKNPERYKFNRLYEKVDPSKVMGMCAVLVQLWKYDQKKIEAIAGFDAMVFTTLIWEQFKLFLVLNLVGYLILAPVYSAGNSGDGSLVQTISLSNVGTGDIWITYFTFFGSATIHVAAIQILNWMFQSLSVKADKFNAIPTEANCTVMITDIEDRFMEKEKLAKFLDGIFPGEVCNVDFCKNLKGVQKLWLKYKKAAQNRELCEKADSQKIGFCCLRKDLDHFKTVESAAMKTFHDAKFESLPTLAVAFIQFKSVKTVALCVSAVLVSGGQSMNVSEVPEHPDQIFWENLAVKRWRRELGIIIGRTFYILSIIFFTPVMVFIQGVANLDNLAEVWSGFEVILDFSPEAVALIQGSLPAILYSLFFVVLPIFLSFFSTLCYLPFKTDEESLTLGRYADCLVGMGLLVPIFASGVFSSLEGISNLAPADIWTSLGNKLPAQSIFFVTYVITASFINMAMNLAMIIPFFQNLVGFYTPQTFNFGTAYSVNILMFTICMTYAVVSPVILIWGCFYFLFSYFTYTYQLIFTFKKCNDTGGSSFPSAYGKLCNGMIIAQMVIIGMLVLVDATHLAALFMLVPFYTQYKRSESKKYAYYFGRTSVGTAQEDVDESIIVVKDNSNFVAPAVKALQPTSNVRTSSKRKFSWKRGRGPKSSKVKRASTEIKSHSEAYMELVSVAQERKSKSMTNPTETGYKRSRIYSL